jgi:hypothetical protein
MSRHGYSDAWQDGYSAALAWFHIKPFWRGFKYRKAWDNGYCAGQIKKTGLPHILYIGGGHKNSQIHYCILSILATTKAAFPSRWMRLHD